MNRENIYIIDIEKDNYIVPKKIKQFDSIKLNYSLYKNSEKINCTGYTIITKIAKPDKTILIKNHENTSEDITINLEKNATKISGIANLEITITNGTKQITTFTNQIIIDKSVITEHVNHENIIEVAEKVDESVLIANETKKELEKWTQDNRDIVDLDNRVSTNANGVTEWKNFRENGGDIGGSLGVKGFRLSSDNRDKYYSQYFNSSTNSVIEIINGNEQYEKAESHFSPIYSGSPKDLGNSDVQWRDIFLSGLSKTDIGYSKLPNGMLLQWGIATATCYGNSADYTIYFPITFPNKIFSIVPNSVNTAKPQSAFGIITNFYDIDNSHTKAIAYDTRNQSNENEIEIRWIAIGY